MKRAARWLMPVLIALAAGAALAQSSGGDFAVRKSVIAAGSAQAQGGDFHVAATAGQHDTGAMSGGDFTAKAGYWPVAGPPDDRIFRNGFDPPP